MLVAGTCDGGGLRHRFYTTPEHSFTSGRRAPLAGTTRTLESNARAHFHFRLHAGTYLIKPIAGTTTKGGRPLNVHVKADTNSTITIRFIRKFQPV